MLLRIIVLNLLTFSLAEIVVFPSGEQLETVAPSAEYNDVKVTGSYLFDSRDILETRLTLYIMVEDFKSSQSQYFRAHPLFMACLQKIKRVFDDDDKEIIVSGFKTRRDPRSGNSIVDDYGQSGAGAELSLSDGSETVDIAKVAVQECWTLFQEQQRDLGVVLFPNKVHIHLRGLSSPEESKPYFDVLPGGNSQEFKSRAQEWLNEALELKVDPPCDSDELALQQGESNSEFNTPEDVVGEMDQVITRNSPEDLKTLWQLAGTDINFNGCPDGMNSNHLDKRCANRLMTPRLYNTLRILNKLVKNNRLGKLNVIEAYKECHPGDRDLHCEGREADVGLNGGDLTSLSRMAICAGADYVKHKGNHILLAVRKQKGSRENWVIFEQNALLDVLPPYSEIDKYKLPDDSDEDLPLFDSSHMEQELLSEFATIADFKEKNSRYFRADPLLVECHVKLILKEQKKQNEKTIYITSSYKSRNTPKDTHSNNDQHSLQQSGRGITINYYENNREMTSEEYFSLAKKIIDQCSPIFTKNGKHLYLRLYANGIFIGISQELIIEIKENVRLSASETHQSIQENLIERYSMAKDGHIIDPDDYENSCLFSDPPKMRSLSFAHKHSEAVQRVRRAIPSPEECIPQSDTEFCKSSAPAREKAIYKLKKEIFRKWIYMDKETFTKALDGCLSVCGTCFSGDIWHDKIENCNNFIHWIPFELYNEDDEERDKSNFYSRENLDLQQHACNEHCIDKTPLFAILGPTIEGIYRPNPTQSVEDRLYPTAGNPSPVFDLLLKMYAMHAHGHATFWIQDEFELAAQRESLKTIMVYNKKITGVSIYVADPEAVDAVSSGIANLVLEWTTTSCPDDSRDFIPRYSVEELPFTRRKRSESDEFASSLLYKRFHFEEEWLDKINYL